MAASQPCTPSQGHDAIMSASHPGGWETSSEYLLFASVVGWLVSAGVAWFFISARPANMLEGFWLPASVAQLACALGSACALLRFHVPVVPAMASTARLAQLSWYVALVAAAAAFPRPAPFAQSGLARAFIVVFVAGAGAACLTFAKECSAGLHAFVALGGVLLLVIPQHFERTPGLNVSLIAGNRIAGVLVLGLALGDFEAIRSAIIRLLEVTHAADVAFVRFLHALLLVAAAWILAMTMWVTCLREHTLPRIRLRARMLGLKSRELLPVVMGLTLLPGMAFVELSRRHGFDGVDRGMQEGLEAAVRLIDWPERADEPIRFDPVKRLEWSGALARLIHSRETIGGAALCTDEGQPRVLVTEYSKRRAFGFDLSEERWAAMLRRAWAARRSICWLDEPDLAGIALVMAPVPPAGRLASELRLAAIVDGTWQRGAVVVTGFYGLLIVLFASLLGATAVVYTVRMLNECEIRSLKEQAEADNHAKGEFLARVSHEVRTPLQSVIGYAELAASEALSPVVARHMHAIRSQGAILLRVVQDILDFSAIRTGEVKLVREVMWVGDLLEDVRRAFHDRASAKGLRLGVETGKDVPERFESDRMRIAQVMLNLVGNAVKFTAKGEVSITVSVVEPERDRTGRLTLEFAVADTGPGIPSLHLRRIFEPFRKFRDDDTPGGGGVGLGLAICEQIVRRMGGVITAESAFGRGSTFRVRLPVIAVHGAETSAERAASARPSVPVHALTGLRVLLVDDNPYVREMLREALRKMGAGVSARPDGNSALEAARTRAFDVALVDLKLPDMDGCTLARALRKLHADQEDPWIVGMSSGISDKRLERALSSGLDEFMLKPISMPGLVETIKLSPIAGRIAARNASRDAAEMVPDEVRSGFLSEAISILNRMETVLEQGRSEQVAAEAHYLANGCFIVGLEEAFAMCREIEELAEAGALEGVDARIDGLRVSISTSRAVRFEPL